MSYFFFFFQAEDGIRDSSVTGVQTCALPISGPFKQDSFDTRVDYSAPRNFQIFGRFSLDYFSLSAVGGLGKLGGNGFGPGGLSGHSPLHNSTLAHPLPTPTTPHTLTTLPTIY